MKIYSNLYFKGAGPVLEMLNTFPSTPTEGQMALVDGVVYIYTTMSGYLTWYPLTNSTNHYIHTQGLESITWTIQHDLGTSNVIFFIYDNNNNLVDANFTLIDNNSFKLDFTIAKLGKVVVFGAADTFSANANSESVTTKSIISAETSQTVFEFMPNGDIMFNGVLKPTVGSTFDIYTYKDISTGYTATVNEYLNIDAISEFTIALPSSHSKNDFVIVNTGSNVETNNITVGGNGSDIKLSNVSSSTLVLDTNTTEVKFKSNGTLWEVL